MINCSQHFHDYKHYLDAHQIKCASDIRDKVTLNLNMTNKQLNTLCTMVKVRKYITMHN